MEDIQDDFFEKIKLTKEEEQIFNKLKDCNNHIQNHDFMQTQREEWIKLIEVGGNLSFNLYSQLTTRGVEVKFNKHCLKNRSESIGRGPECLEFHNHIDVINGLVSFLEFKHVHDDIGDVTLGVECIFEVYCKRRSEPGLTYKTHAFIKRTPNGWWVRHVDLNKETDKQCSALLDHIDSQAICLPKDFGFAFEYLWNQAEVGLEIWDFKKQLKEIANWLEVTEHGRPDWF